MTKATIDYLELLSRFFPNAAAASAEIINLNAILSLPKGTEHFIADVHGADEAFLHLLKTASGNIRRKVDEYFGDSIRESEKRQLCTLIYYPKEKLVLIKETERDMDDWYRITIPRLVAVLREVSAKYTNSKIRKALPPQFSYIIGEFLQESMEDDNKALYLKSAVDAIIETDSADKFIIAISEVIQKLAIDVLHLLGDIYDRGPGPHIILDHLAGYRQWDIQWGNHDILWMGAAAGNEACICNVVRICLRYANFGILEEGYGINLLPLTTFAIDVYGNDPAVEFMPKSGAGCSALNVEDKPVIARMHKAISIIQFKVENAMFRAHPEWGMESRIILPTWKKDGTVEIEGKRYPLTSNNFPTLIEGSDELTPREAELLKKLYHSFTTSEKLQAHIALMLKHGCMYKITNGNLLYHAAIPMNPNGTLKKVLVGGKKLSGRNLLHAIGMQVRKAFDHELSLSERREAIDYFLYLWCGPDSPLFNKSKMTTFERYWIADKATHEEKKGVYYELRDDPKVVDYILDAFGVEGKDRHIINGHVPVHASRGEDPIKADGKLLVIDGGISESYHKETGIAGYTLVYHSKMMELVQHEAFTTVADAVAKELDIKGTKHLVEWKKKRMLVRDTDTGRELQKQINNLWQLLEAYRSGVVREKAVLK